MEQKQFTLINRGMNRDLSVSKTGESSAYENHNIRITARDNDTFLSVTNERGNKEVNLGNMIDGDIIGWNVLNNHIIIFTHDESTVKGYTEDHRIQVQKAKQEYDEISSYNDRIQQELIHLSENGIIEPPAETNYIENLKAILTVEKSKASSGYSKYYTNLGLDVFWTLAQSALTKYSNGLMTITIGTDYSNIGIFVRKLVDMYKIVYTDLLERDRTLPKPDKIYRIDYNGGEFKMHRNLPLFAGNLNLDTEHPIESVVYFETEDIQKIYWVDGKNVLRFMNIAATEDELARWNNTSFDSNRAAGLDVSVSVSKDNSGETRANGVVQYLLTYYDKHGHETGYVWISDLIYLSPIGHGGAADDTNNNQVFLTFEDLDTNFTNFRVYSVFRSSLNGNVVAYLVADMPTSDNPVLIVDDGAHLTLQDTTSLLYLGSLSVVAGTLEHKDQTLFLGDLSSVGRKDYTKLEELLREEMFILETGQVKFVDGGTWRSKYVFFDYSDDDTETIKDIPYVKNVGNYPYENQLIYSSSEITTFKGGEKYRFALKFKTADGTETDAFWIGDVENDKYPIVNESTGRIKRIIAKCTIPEALRTFMQNNGYVSVQLMIAEATYADRSVKAQGIVNPTMFNTWERYNNRQYAIPSWITRVRGANYANLHFDSVKNSLSTAGEIQCNYWADGSVKTPFFQYKNYKDSSSSMSYDEEFEGFSSYDLTMVCYMIGMSMNPTPWNVIGIPVFTMRYWCDVNMFIASIFVPGVRTEVENFKFSEHLNEFTYDSQTGNTVYTKIVDGVKQYEIVRIRRSGFEGERTWNHGGAREDLFNAVANWFTSNGYTAYLVDRKVFSGWCETTYSVGQYKPCYFNYYLDGNSRYQPYYPSLNEALDAVPSGGTIPTKDRWDEHGEVGDTGHYGNKIPALYKKNLMFVDENVVTLNSPEIEYGAINFDSADYNFRIIGIAKMSSIISDYTVNATKSAVPGESLDMESFSGALSSGRKNLDGVITWPMWKDYGLRTKKGSEIKEEIKDRDPSDYEYRKGGIIHYWMYMWNHIGTINGRLSEEDEEASADLNYKTFANLRFSYKTMYFNTPVEYDNSDLGSVRIVDDLNEVDYNIVIGEESRYYRGIVSLPLSMPGKQKYPLIFSDAREEDTEETINSVFDDNSQIAFLYSTQPIQLAYTASSHAVITLPTKVDENNCYNQTILPYFFDSEKLNYSQLRTSQKTGALLPWIDNNDSVPNYMILDRDIYGNPEYTVVEYDAESKVGIFQRYFDNDAEYRKYFNNGTDVFSAAMNYFGGNDVYITIEANNTIYTILVNNYKPMWNGVNHGVYFPDAKVISEVPVSSSDERQFIVKWVDISGPQSVYGNGTGWLYLPSGNCYATNYQFKDYQVTQPQVAALDFDERAGRLSENDKYIFIGEIYTDYGEGKADKRYGGINLSNVKGNRFINAGPAYTLNQLRQNDFVIYGNSGDTFFQRWDDLRIKPSGKDAPNGVIDITSVLLETHINLDGRSDLQRGVTRLASIDTSTFGQLNPVYSQPDNFVVRRDLDEDFNQDIYCSAITWTKQKNDSAEIDEWTHITLANTLKLDADKGICRSLCRFQNSLIAFQDKGISEILFNSRTQLSTQDGVPVEIANSGKVDGQRYLSNRYGCTNKWSIVEGRNALYFIDSINKGFCAFNGSIENLSAKLGFSNWFRKNNNIDTWLPNEFNNIISFYDKVHSDVYLVKSDKEEQSCLVYNELLGAFTSFFDYGSMLMLVNVDDKLVSFKNNKLWLQNEGFYCNFFGEQFDFWMQYRVAPNPMTDKIWTNIDYRADFYTVLDENGDLLIDGSKDIINLDEADYKEDETFDVLKVWNEYQTTGEKKIVPVKKFRTWRYVIPRAETNSKNRFGLDRIRNPWVNILLKKHYDDDSQINRDLMQLHDITTIYFE